MRKLLKTKLTRARKATALRKRSTQSFRNFSASIKRQFAKAGTRKIS